MEFQTLADEQLISLIAQADKRALAVLYDRYGRVVFSLAMKMLESKEAAEEITQDAFLKVWISAGTFQPGKGKFSSWLLGITHNRAIDELRKRRRIGPSSSCDDPAIENSLASNDIEVAEKIIGKMRDESVVRALGELPTAQQEAIKLAYFNGLTQAEIAQKVGAPLGTIKTRMRLGLRRLRSILVERSEEVEAL